MRILNLAGNIHDIQYHVNHYPDGQRDLVIKDVHILREEQVPIQIRTRLTNFEDLNLLICAVKSLQNAKVKQIQLYISYLLGARSDRLFQEGGVSYLRDVVAPILNSLNLEKIWILDPHNPDVTQALIKNCYIETSCEFVKKVIIDIEKSFGDYVLLLPDAGAFKRIYSIAEYLDYKDHFIFCNKIRNLKTGKITDLQINTAITNISKKQIVIIDDLIDGGGTFIKIAEGLQKLNSQISKPLLICTHSIFSKGINILKPHFERIYTTNSYSDMPLYDKDFVTKYKVI